jgi:hypothetical protein
VTTLHLAEVMEISIRAQSAEIAAASIETRLATERRRQVRQSMFRAGLTAGAVVGRGIFALRRAWRR